MTPSNIKTVRRTVQDILANFLTVSSLPNQELSVLYGGPTLNYGGQLSLYVPYMLSVNMTGDLAHLQLSDLQGETRPIQGESLVYREKECLYAERNSHFFY